MIWTTEFTLDGLNRTSQHNMVSHIGIEFTEYGDDYLVARMPVDERTVQPFRILHGGASAALAETVGSLASTLCLEDSSGQVAVGTELNISHLRSIRNGYVYATARPYRIGRRIHVWNIEIRDDQQRLISVSRLTLAIIEQRR